MNVISIGPRLAEHIVSSASASAHILAGLLDEYNARLVRGEMFYWRSCLNWLSVVAFTVVLSREFHSGTVLGK